MKNNKNKLFVTVDEKTATRETQLMLVKSDLEHSEEVKKADLKLQSDKRNPELWMERGLALSKQRLNMEAADSYSMGLLYDPFNWLLLRHRGHKHLATYKFEKAAYDLELASRINSNDFDIWYHLGLSCYLLDDFEKANSAYERCLDVIQEGDINLVAIVNWKYLTLMRLGKVEEAKEVLKLVTKDTEAGENEAYKDMVLSYKGEISVEEALEFENEGYEALEFSTRGYGIAMNMYFNGKKAEAEQLLRKIYSDNTFWTAFGYVAALTELEKNRLNF